MDSIHGDVKSSKQSTICNPPKDYHSSSMNLSFKFIVLPKLTTYSSNYTHQVEIFYSKRERGELWEVWGEKVAGIKEIMLQNGIIRFLLKSHLYSTGHHNGLQL